MQNKLTQGLALVLAFFVGYAPTAWAVDVHIFRNPTTLVPVGASVDATGKFQGDGSALTNLPSTAHSNGANCSAGNSPLGVDANGVVEACFDVETGAEATSHEGNASAHHTATVDTNTQNVINATPVNGSLTTSVSSDYVFDHNANASAHHTATVDTTDGNAKTLCADNTYLKGQDATTCVSAGTIVTDGGAVTGAHTTTLAHSALTAVGTSDHHVKTVDTNTQNVIDDTPSDGNVTQSASSNSLFDHDADASAHHVKTTALAHSAITAVGASDHHVKTTALAHSAITAVGTSDHHVKTVDTNTNADTQCGSGEYLNGTGGCDQANGLLSAYEGKKTQANICLDSPSATGNFMTQSDSPYQVWTASGTAIGQWIGSQNSLGPCL